MCTQYQYLSEILSFVFSVITSLCYLVNYSVSTHSVVHFHPKYGARSESVPHYTSVVVIRRETL